MKINNHHARAASLGCALAMLSASAAAMAGNVTYTVDAAGWGLFGTPTVSGDTLLFAPTGFSASQTSAPLGKTATINITVTAAPGYLLNGFSLSESGGYTLSGGSAYATGSFKAVDIEGTTGNQIPVSFSGILDGGTWNAHATIALPATGWGGTDGEVSSVTLTLSNLLYASGNASIWKEGVSITSHVTAVPEADTYAMLLAGLGLVGFMARRRARHTA
jgi:hypothetical protein